MTEQQRLPASDQKRNAKHLHIQELFFKLHSSFSSFQSSSDLNTISYLAHYAVNEYAIIKSVFLSSDVLQENHSLATIKKNLT